MHLIVWLLGILAGNLVILPKFTECFARNCDETTEGKRECLRVPGYDGFQYARCSSHSFIQNVSQGFDSCIQGHNSLYANRFCWYACERQMNNRTEGVVSPNCRCGNYQGGNIIWDYDFTEYISGKNKDPVDQDLLKTLKNCSYLTDTTRVCFHDKKYERSQWITCRSSSYVYQKTRGNFRCDPKRLYCWIPCQKEDHESMDGEVSEECSCDSNSQSKNSSGTLNFSSSTMLLLLFSTLFCMKVNLFQ